MAVNAHFSSCTHCKKRCNEDFLVHASVWTAAGLDYHSGVLHLVCLEQLLGRVLTLDDFDMRPPQANRALRFGYELARRELAPPPPW